MSSMWRRALRVARSNLNDIAGRARSIGRGSSSLEEMSDAELEAELERRRREHATRAAVEKAKTRAAKNKGPTVGGAREGASAPAVDLTDLPPQKRREFRQYYANLELPFGASLDEVKRSYRRLMRQYHPDKHQADPARRELATQLSQKLTVAYNELNKLLKNRK